MNSFLVNQTAKHRLKLSSTQTFLGVITTLTAFSMFVWETFYSHSGVFEQAGWFGKLEILLFVGIISFLVYGNLVYQFTRQAYLSRKSQHTPSTRMELEGWYTRKAPWVTILVPAYKEEPSVVYQTLMSAALQDYPNCRIVLLIDDPPLPTDKQDHENLAALRALPHQLQGVFDNEKEKIEKTFVAFCERERMGFRDSEYDVNQLLSLSQEIQSWFRQQAASFGKGSHTDRFFAQNILLTQSVHLDRRRAKLQRSHTRNQDDFSQMIHQEFRFLHTLFSCEISCFERKRYRNLSHEPNKAMNLNTYMGLMGKSLLEKEEEGGLLLEPNFQGNGPWEIPDAKYVLTLDADSLLLPDYTLRLVDFMERPENERVAVAQTPYSAIPDAPNLIERIAGATTDIQYIIHQGFTKYEGTYWVGANALLRKSALREIARTSGNPNLPIIKFIRDRTVIEDTESSVDLIAGGWKLFNYPQRLAFSATPPDFGALLIQRRRWANGGLLIFPRLLRYLFNKRWSGTALKECFMRSHYLLSITGVNLGLVLLLFYPFNFQMNSLWLTLMAAPYFALYGRDLTLIGYQWMDLPRVYAFNLLLVPVHLGGVFKSIQQGITGRKTPFCRTPKVSGRTSAPALYIVAVFGILFLMLVRAVDDYVQHYWMHLTFVLMNAGFLIYSVIRYVGIRASIEDLRGRMSQYFPKNMSDPHPLALSERLSLEPFARNIKETPVRIRD